MNENKFIVPSFKVVALFFIRLRPYDYLCFAILNMELGDPAHAESWLKEIPEVGFYFLCLWIQFKFIDYAFDFKKCFVPKNMMFVIISVFFKIKLKSFFFIWRFINKNLTLIGQLKMVSV